MKEIVWELEIKRELTGSVLTVKLPSDIQTPLNEALMLDEVPANELFTQIHDWVRDEFRGFAVGTLSMSKEDIEF